MHPWCQRWLAARNRCPTSAGTQPTHVGKGRIAAQQARRRGSRNRVAAAVACSERARMLILTPDSSFWGPICPFGANGAHRRRCCSGSLDRLFLGHLCTNRAENGLNREERVQGSYIEHGKWMGRCRQLVWGTAGKQWHGGQIRVGRAGVTQTRQQCNAGRALGVQQTASDAPVSLPLRCALDSHCPAHPLAANGRVSETPVAPRGGGKNEKKSNVRLHFLKGHRGQHRQQQPHEEAPIEGVC